MTEFKPSQTTVQHWAARDLQHVWHPCTQMKDHEWLPMISIQKAQGVWLYDHDGRRYLDAISSWWVNTLGHANPEINAALSQQAEQLPHIIMAGFTHEPAVQLAEALVQITPAPLQRCFFADNGSAAVEVALKMSFHYWLNQTSDQVPRKTKFIALANSYHGETLGALSVGDVELYKQTYQPLLMQPIIAPSPDSYQSEPGETAEAFAIRQFAGMETLLEQHAHETCAVILEPLVQCAGSMRMYHPTYLKLLREACDRHDVHLIADEIAVGFGRTGRLFACEHADISPDFLLLSKGLTAGYLPLAVVMTTESVYAAFYTDYEQLQAFLHSHSYTGNALACRVALTSLQILQRDHYIERNQQTARLMGDAVAELHDHPKVADIRQQGMILAIELTPDGSRQSHYLWQQRRGLRVYQYGLQHEALLRPLGNVVYFMPPYVISPDEIKQMAKVAIDGIHHATLD